MNNPAYIVTEVFTQKVQDVATALGFPVYSHYGYVNELNENLQQLSESPKDWDKKFPAVWLVEPFVIQKSGFGVYGNIPELRMFILMDSDRNYKAPERKEKVYKTRLYPILNELLDQFCSYPFMGYRERLRAVITDRYYWGEDQKTITGDVVDTIEVKLQNLRIHSNPNC